MRKSYVSTRCCDRGSHMPGRAQGVTPEEPAAENLHGGIREGGAPRRAMVDLFGHEAGNGGHSQRTPTAHRVSSTRSEPDHCPALLPSAAPAIFAQQAVTAETADEVRPDTSRQQKNSCPSGAWHSHARSSL